MARLDRGTRAFYTARPLRWWGAVLVGLWAAAAGAEVVGGVQLPDGVQKVGENRYRAPDTFDKTLEYYRAVYGVSGYPRRQIVNQPGVKAVHISNPSGRNFEGLNIYEANEEVRIYIVPLTSVKGKKAPAPKAAPGKRGAKKR